MTHFQKYANRRQMVKKHQLPEPPRPEHKHNSLKEKNILVIATGGTLCMKPNAEGCYEPVANYIPGLLKRTRSLHDSDYFNEHVRYRSRAKNTLVLPKEKTHDTRVIYTIHEYFPLIDSSNMQIEDYRKIADDIFESYHLYDGFVVLHGTDTLAYTASNLSFMFMNLAKPVILTGAQVPAAEMRSDAFDNIQGALVCAGLYDIPEVSIFFNRKLLRGNRTQKVNADEFDAFQSPNFEPLVKMGIHIQINKNKILKPSTDESFGVVQRWNSRVALLRLFPAITAATVKTFLANVDGVVIQTYGAGNGPSEREDILQELKMAAKRGVLIVNVTQCQKGSVSSAYEAGRKLEKAGVIGGYDMTVEAALAKLSYVCGMDLSISEKQRLISKNLRGELTDSENSNDELQSVICGIRRLLSNDCLITRQNAQDQILSALFGNMPNYKNPERDSRRDSGFLEKSVENESLYGCSEGNVELKFFENGGNSGMNN